MESWRSHVPKNVENAKIIKRVNTLKCENAKMRNCPDSEKAGRVLTTEWKLEMEVDIASRLCSLKLIPPQSGLLIGI